MHGVFARYHRRGIELKGYGAATDDIVVRRGSINREVARLDSGRIHWSEYGDNKISQLRRDRYCHRAAGYRSLNTAPHWALVLDSKLELQSL